MHIHTHIHIHMHVLVHSNTCTCTHTHSQTHIHTRRLTRSRKGKDGLFKNKVWVPPKSSGTVTTATLKITSQNTTPPKLPNHSTSNNRVWIPPPRAETEVIFLSPKPVSRVEPVKQDEPAKLLLPPPPPTPPPPALAMVGRETKTKQGNKQWVVSRPATNSSSAASLVRPVKPVRLFGHEKKTKQGNRQWVVASLSRYHHAPFRRRVASVRNRRSSLSKSSLVCLDGGRYALSSSGKKLKRLSTSSASHLATHSPAISHYLGGVANSSVKRMMARCVGCGG